MAKITMNELKNKRNRIIDKMEDIVNSKTITRANSEAWDIYNIELERIDKEIAEQKQKNYARNHNYYLDQRASETALRFKDWLKNIANGTTTEPFRYEMRADPFKTTTDVAIINKTVKDNEILYSPGEDFLRSLNVTFFDNLGGGQLILPYLTQDTAGWVAEDASAASANMVPKSMTLTPRRVSHTQSVTKELLANTNNPKLYLSILNNLHSGVFNAIVKDLFDNITVDCAAQTVDASATTLSWTHICNMESSLGTYQLNTNYLTHPSVKSYLKTTQYMSNLDSIWKDDDILNGYPAYSHPSMPAKEIVYGDFSKAVVCMWGPINVIVDPYSAAVRGVLELTVEALVDTAIWNPDAFTILKNCSIG